MNGLAYVHLIEPTCSHTIYQRFYTGLHHCTLAAHSFLKTLSKTMAQQSPTICQGLLTELLPAFEKIQGGSLRFKESLAALRSIRRLSSVDSLGTLSLDNGSRRNLFHLLATCLNEARILMSDQLCIIFKILADASRERKWNPRGHCSGLMQRSEMQRALREQRIAFHPCWMAT